MRVSSSQARTAPRLLSTTVVGSLPQPVWLVDHSVLHDHAVPRVQASDIWRVAPQLLRQAQDDAALLAIRGMERAGIDVITDGEVRRESYSNHFVLKLAGIDCERPATLIRAGGRVIYVPRIVGPIHRTAPVSVQELTFLRANTDRRVRITLPGPFTLAQQAADEYYRDPGAAIFAFADALNEEARDLATAGADVIQIDEPWLRNDPAAAEKYAVTAINRVFEGIPAQRAVHLCFGYGMLVGHSKPKTYSFLEQLVDANVDQVSIEAAQPNLELSVLSALGDKTIMLGVLDLSTHEVESAELVATRIRAGLRYLAPERLMPAPDCGMKYLPWDAAIGKLTALSKGAAIVRAELGDKS